MDERTKKFSRLTSDNHLRNSLNNTTTCNRDAAILLLCSRKRQRGRGRRRRRQIKGFQEQEAEEVEEAEMLIQNIYKQKQTHLMAPKLTFTSLALLAFLVLSTYIGPLSSTFQLEADTFYQKEPGEAPVKFSGLIATNNSKVYSSKIISEEKQHHHHESELIQQQSLNSSSGNLMQTGSWPANNSQQLVKANSSQVASAATQEAANNDGGDKDRPLIIIIMTANVIIFIIGFIGNAVVILVILKFTRIETVTDIYILNLAVADLMFITGLVFLVTTMFKGDWIFGYLMCKLYMASTSLNQFASSLLLVVMSFDRFLAVCHPIRAQSFRRIKNAKIICGIIWIICLVLMSPIFAFAKISKDLTCAIFWPEYKDFNCEVAFTLYSFALGFALPLLLIAAFYLCVIRKLRIAASGAQTTLGSSRRSRSRETTNKRIEHLVVGIICTYTVCWLPYWMTQLCVSFITNDRQPIPGFYGIFLTASSLSYTNSALNPILYAFLSDNFKRRCSDIIRSIYSLKLFQQLCCLELTTKSGFNSGSGAGGGGGGRSVGGGGGNGTGKYLAVGGHSYHQAAPTTTNCCEIETETTRPDVIRSNLYLNESGSTTRCSVNNNNNNYSTTNIKQSTRSSFDAHDTLAQDSMRHLAPEMDTDDETGSSSIALNCLDITSQQQQQQQQLQRKKSVNFSSNTNFILANNSNKDLINDDEHSKSYHKIQCDRNKCQDECLTQV